MTKGSINSIESMGLVDGPGVRCVVFLNGCGKRCLYCHNPEMWEKKENNITPLKLVEKIKRFKPYFKNGGGVTFSGGEALLQPKFLIETMRLLKEEKIHIALDTAGTISKYNEEILKLTDLVLLDIKHVEKNSYKTLTGRNIKEQEEFIPLLNKFNKDVWIRQVITPGITDSKEYVEKLKKYLNKINNIKKVEFLPYHKMGISKYEKLGIFYPLRDTQEMKKEDCDKLYEYFLSCN